MTEFEQQVAKALRPILADAEAIALPATDLLELLAPRLAAASEAGLKELRGNCAAAEWPGLQASYYAAFLAALRGAP